jgi:hypothetical protein
MRVQPAFQQTCKSRLDEPRHQRRHRERNQRDPRNECDGRSHAMQDQVEQQLGHENHDRGDHEHLPPGRRGRRAAGHFEPGSSDLVRECSHRASSSAVSPGEPPKHESACMHTFQRGCAFCKVGRSRELLFRPAGCLRRGSMQALPWSCAWAAHKCGHAAGPVREGAAKSQPLVNQRLPPGSTG